jgi:pimeloyl-ACP methyl ester carboxylesterase
MQLVFIHGAMNDHTVWAAQSRYFTERGHKVLAIDLPAHGNDDATPLSSVAAMADWLLATLDAAGVTQTALIGHSMGSLIALEATARAPQRVSHLAMLGSSYPMKVADALLDTARNDEAKAIEMVTKWSHTRGYANTEALRQLMQRLAGKQLLHTDLTACNAYNNGAAAAVQVHCPTLFIFGANDVMTPPALPFIANAQAITLASGHALMTEQADAVNQALGNFIGSR